MSSLKKILVLTGIVILAVFPYSHSSAQLASGIPHIFSVSTITPPVFPAGSANILPAGALADESVNLVSPVFGTWNFNFAGVNYGKVAVSTNGWLALLPASAAVIPASVTPLPANSLITNPTGYPIIAPLWDDLSTSVISWVVPAASNTLWVRWSVKWDKTNASTASLFYVKLDGNFNTTTFYYANNAAYVPILPFASIGIAGICAGDFYSASCTANNAATVDSIIENPNIGSAGASNQRPYNCSFTFSPYGLNDDCANAAFLGTISGACTNFTSSIINATASGTGNCSSSDVKDVWFTYFKPVGVANVKIITSPASCGSVTGTSIEVYDACGGTMIGCNSSGTTYPTYGEKTLNRSPCVAETLWVRVTSDLDVAGKFQICAQDVAGVAGVVCANAVPVCYPMPFNSTGLTTAGSGNDYNDSILCTSAWMTGQDYIFSFTPTTTACFNISIDGTGVNSYPGLFITDGCPNDTALSRCVASATSASNGDTIFNLTLVSGRTYYIIVDNNATLAGFNSMPFNFHIWQSVQSAPPNNTCGGAASLGNVAFNQTCTWSGTFVTNCATPSPTVPSPNCGGFSSTLTGDVWFTFTPTFTGIVMINSQGSGTNPVIHGGMAVYSGTCGSLTLVACAGDSVSIPFMPSLSINVASATVYYIRFWSAPGFDPGSFQICFQSNCNPPNDLPVNAQTLPLGVPTFGDNTCSTGISEPPAITCTHDGTNIPNTVWFKLTIPPSGQVAVRLSQVSLVDVAVAAYLFPTGPANAASSNSQLACNDDIIFAPPCPVCGMTGDNDAAIQFTGAAGAMVYILVDGAASWTGSFYITAIEGTLTSVFPPVFRKDCANPEFICGNSNYILPNGGIGSDGNICDFTNMACSGGATRSEVGSAWLTFTVAAGSQLGFTITPNDSAGPVSNYNFFLWDITNVANICNQLTITPPLVCNTAAGTGKTGLRTPTSTVFNAPIAAQGTAKTYMLYIENQTSANDDENVPGTNTGFMLNWDIYSGGVNIGSTQLTGTSPTSTWSGTVVNTDYQNLPNWKGTGSCPAVLPSCTTDVFISAATSQCWVTGNSYAKNITINPGGTLRIAAGGNLHVCGNYINNGSLIAVAGSTITFEGPANQTISGSLTGGNAFASIVINKVAASGNVTLNNNLDVTQNFTTINGTSIFNINGKYMKVGGHFTNNNGATTFTGIGSSTVEFNGNTNANFINTSGVIVLNRVVMNKTGAKLYLSGGNSSMNIDTALTLTLGIMVSPVFAGAPLYNMKYFLSTAITGHNANSYINGKLRRKISNPTGPASPSLPASYDFPVGDSLTPGPGGYELANINIISSTLVDYLIAYFQPWPSLPPVSGPAGPMECIYATYNSSPLLDNGYWTFERPVTPSNGVYNVTLYNTGYTNSAGNQGWSMVKANTGSPVNVAASWSLWAVCKLTSTLTSVKRDSLNAPLYPGSFNHYYATAQSLSPLPIELLYFNAEPTGDKVMCMWETASETNNEYFIVERSNDGIEYHKIGQIDGFGHGTSTTQLSYSLLDQESCKGIIYYRLRQVDIDGKFSYSEPVAVNCKDELSELTLHPNPAHSTITLSFSENNNGVVYVKFIDFTGRVVLVHESNVKKGNNQISIDVEKLINGVYGVVLESKSDEDRLMQTRFIKN